MATMSGSPFWRGIALPPCRRPVRILGPLRSCRMATWRLARCAALRISAKTAACSACVPCEKLRRITSTPAAINASSTAGFFEAGPIVAMILVCRIFSAYAASPAPREPMSVRLPIVIALALGATLAIAPGAAAQDVYPVDLFRDLPSANVFALLEAAQPEATTDRFNSGGLNGGEPDRAGAFLASWSQTQYRLGDVQISSPVDGTPMLFPDLAWFERI